MDNDSPLDAEQMEEDPQPRATATYASKARPGRVSGCSGHTMCLRPGSRSSALRMPESRC